MRRNDIIREAVHKAHTAGHEQALSRVFASLGRVFAAQLGIVSPSVAKAHAPSHPAEPAHPEPDPHAALLLAQLDHLIRCHESKHDHKPGHKALHSLWHDPESLAGVLALHVAADRHVQKAIAFAMFLKSAEQAPKGGATLSSPDGGAKFFAGGQWIPAQAIKNAKPEERKYIEEQRKESDPRTKKDSLTREKSRKQIADVAADIIRKPDERTPDKFRDLAESAAAAIEAGHLSLADMRALRLKLGSALGESPRQNDMTATLANHATADAPLTALPTPDGAPPKPDSIGIVNTDSLAIDPTRFQFKMKVNAEGVTSALANAKAFQPKFAGVIAVWHDPHSNRLFVVNGHHRYALAKRFNYPQLAVYYINAKDAREARAQGALINIAEGRGSAVDAAKFLRDSGRGPQDLYDAGIDPSEPVARDASILANLNDHAFDRLARGGLELSTALAVAKHVTDPERQERLFKLIAKRQEAGDKFTQKHIEEMARQMASAPSATVDNSGSLFDTDPSEEDTFLERADLASHIRGQLSKEHHDYGALASTRRAEATQDAGNILNVEENRKRAGEAGVHRSAFDTLAHRHGPVAAALDAGAVAIKQARTQKEKERARTETLGNVRTALARAVTGRPEAEQLGMETVGGSGAEGAGGGEGIPAADSTGGGAADGRGLGNAAPRLDATSPALAGTPRLGPRGTWIPGASSAHPPHASAASATSPALARLPTGDAPFPPQWIPGAGESRRPELSSPNGISPSADGGGAASPLHALAHFAHDPAALRAESERLRDIANKTKAQGGNLEFHDAMTAALRGEHGPELRDAVSRALDDWNGHQGDTAKRYARVAEEVAKLTKKSEAELGTEAKPQEEAAQAAPPAAEPESPLVEEKVSEHDLPSDEEFAAASKPYTPPERAAAEPLSPNETDLAHTPAADIPAAVARGAVSLPSAGGIATASRKRGRKPEHRAEAHKYSVDSARAITQTPDMSRAESAAANAAANPPLPTRPTETHPHARAIRDIPVGDSRYVAGHRVRRDGEDSYQTEKRGGFLRGTADAIASHISDSLDKQQGFGSLPDALARADAYAEPDPFTDLARSDADAKMRSAVPDGARGVSLDENTRGRVGTVRHDPLTGRTWLQFDGSTEERGHDFEPLDAAHSWRASDEDRAARTPKGGETGSLFGDEDEGAKAALANRDAEVKAKPQPAAEVGEKPALFENEQDNLFNAPAEEETATEPVAKPAAKEPHEMTLAEFRKSSHAPKYDPAIHDDSIDLAKLHHMNHVTGALQRGDAVPPEVMSEYPHLKDAARVKHSGLQDGWDSGHLIKARTAANMAGVDWKGKDADQIISEIKQTVSGDKPSQVAPAAKFAVGDKVKVGNYSGEFLGQKDKDGVPHAVVQIGRGRDGSVATVPMDEVGRKGSSPELSSPNGAAPAEIPAPSTPSAPHVALAHTLESRLRSGSLEKNELWKHADAHFGGTRAEGKYGPSDAYDALEAGLNKSFRGQTDPTADLASAQEQARALEKIVDSLPTQTNRSGNKESHQQFSTPPHYSFAANWVANLTPGEHVLEPSAGTGNLTTHAQNAGAVVHANELDPRRADFLRDQLDDAHVHVENAEQIAGILPKKGVQPTTVVMNPPFSQTAGRMGDKKELMTGARHIEEAGRMLAPGGRLVSIVGGGSHRGDPTRGAGMSPNSPTYKKWFADMAKKGFTLRANVGVNGDEYKKYGTTFGTRLLVFDKRPPMADDKPVLGDAADIPDLMAKLEGVRNDRSQVAPRPSDEQVGDGLPESAEGDARPGDAAALATGDGVSSEGAAEDVPVAGLPSGTAGAGGIASGAKSGTGGAADGAGIRATRKRGGKAAAQPAPATAADVSGQTPSDLAKATNGAGGGASAGGKPVPQSGVRPPARVKIEPRTVQASDTDLTRPAGGESDQLGESLYSKYTPSRLNIPGWQHHPTNLVESAAMAAVQPPVPTYSPTLSPDVIEGPVREVRNPDGTMTKKKIGLTDASLESVVYAGQAHQNFLPAAEGEEPTRRGFFTGDGTGVGKGRIAAGIISDNINQGKPKHVWLSKGDKLFNDAKRDFADMGMNPDDIVHFDDLSKGGFKRDKGTVFMPYTLLASGPKDQTKPRNVDNLIKWLGKDFDGVITMDEAHLLGNADDTPGARGVVKASDRAKAAIQLQRALPKARVVYMSATGATKPENLAYAERLGLWGRGTSFADKKDFLEQMHAGGTSALESVAQSLKARGLYNARSLSYDGVKTNRLSHTLSDEQKYVYDNLADGWQSVLQNIDKAIESIAGGKENVKHTGRAKSAAMGQFQGAQQRFFNQIITSMMVPTLIKSMENDLKNGHSPVVQLTNTMKASLDRAMAKREEGEDLEEIDVSPRDILTNYLEKSFPIHRMEKYQDDEGNEHMRIATDSSGRPIEDPDAVAMRDELMTRAHDLKIPQSPLDQIINHFGHENVAEATSRDKRLVRKADENGVVRLTEEKRDSKLANESEARAFQSGKKKIMIFSEAGGTGASYHADKSALNQSQRQHYLLQPGWRADTAVQGLGRTHRTNQAVPPVFHLLDIPEIPGQKRFVSTIARRLGQLGALTRGQAKTGGGVELFNAADNLESNEAQAGLESFVNTLKRGGTTVNGQGYHELMTKLGFKVDNDAGGGGGYRVKAQREVPEMRQFLNRVLALKLSDQQELFKQLDEHVKSKVEQARADGTLDEGVEKFKADRIDRTGDPETIYRDPETGAEAKLVRTTAKRKTDRRAFKTTTQGKLPLHFVKNDRSGRVWAVYDAAAKTDDKGNIVPMYALKGPGATQHVPQHQIDPTSYRGSGYTRIEHPEAKELWDAEHDAMPEHVETPEHFVTGDLLSVWDKLPGDRPKIYRVPMSDGTSIVGRHIPAHQVENTLRNLGVTQKAKAGEETGHAPADVHRRVLGGATATLANGWRVKRSLVGHERRLELDGPIGMHKRTLEQDGVRVEKIASKERYFIPVGADGVKVLERVIRSRNAPVTDVRAV